MKRVIGYIFLVIFTSFLTFALTANDFFLIRGVLKDKSKAVNSIGESLFNYSLATTFDLKISEYIEEENTKFELEHTLKFKETEEETTFLVTQVKKTTTKSEEGPDVVVTVKYDFYFDGEDLYQITYNDQGEITKRNKIIVMNYYDAFGEIFLQPHLVFVEGFHYIILDSFDSINHKFDFSFKPFIMGPTYELISEEDSIYYKFSFDVLKNLRGYELGKEITEENPYKGIFTVDVISFDKDVTITPFGNLDDFVIEPI